MKNSIFIFSHQDDEFGVFEPIRNAIKQSHNVIIYYMTNGKINKSIPKNILYHRDLESLKVLKKIGVKKKNVIFFGRINNIETCCLYKKLEYAYKILSKKIIKTQGKKIIYTHALEGGNEDHDACYAIVKKLINNLKDIQLAFQFPLYNSNNSLFYYQVQKIIISNGKLIKIKTKFFNRIRYISYLFYYKSQLRTWIGLYPFIVFNLLFRDYYCLQKIDKNLNIRKPHNGKLLYEKFKRCSFSDIQNQLKKFLNS